MKIDKNTEIPKPKNEGSTGKGAPRKYPFPSMEVGDSFLVECKGDAQKINTACYLFKRKNPDFNFTVRTVEGGVRVWRIEAKKEPF